MPDNGKGDLVLQTVQGSDALRLSLAVQAAKPRMAAALEKSLNDGLAQLDESRARSRAVLKPVLTSTRQALATDPKAPAGTKKAAASLTMDTLLDPSGDYTAMRKSIKIARKESNLTAEVTFPENQIHSLTRGGTMTTLVMASGVLSAIAIPNFIKFQCRSKQSEAKSLLKNAFTAQKAYYMEHDHYGQSFEEIGFSPEPGTRYTYCMNNQCLACTAPGCKHIPDEDNPCLAMLANSSRQENEVTICAVGDVDNNHDPDDLDIWVISGNGELENRYNDCN